MSQSISSKPVSHVYAFALSWLLFAFINIELNSIVDIFFLAIAALCISVIVFIVSFFIRKSKKPRDAVVTLMPDPVATNNPELDAVVQDAQVLLKELMRAKEHMKNQDMIHKTDEIVDISYKIIEKLYRHPQLLSSAKRFFNYYLPTTTKLLTNYNYMERQGVTGGNISTTMQKIENTLGTLTTAYRSQLDALFSQTALDLETDIDVLETLLKKEGLADNTLKNTAFDIETDLENI